MTPQADQNSVKDPANKEDHKEFSGKQNGPLLPRKVYTHRNSVLTDLMLVSHLQTVHNISVAIFILLLVNAVIYYLASPEVLWIDLKTIQWAASNPLRLLRMWVFFNIYALVMFQGFKMWVRMRNKINTKFADFIFMVAFLASIVFIFTATPYVMLQHSFHPITCFSIMCEQVRIFMKVYSFIRECAPRVLKYKPSEDGDQEQSLYPSNKYFLYFLFVPALIYRDSYPQTREIKWKFIANMMFQFFACVFIAYCFFTRFVIDIFKTTGSELFTLPQAALTLAGSMAIGSLMMFMIFYSILHTWLNAFAELTYFGDREFYQDWWNSTTFSEYYKKWNVVVYDWLYAYVYVDSSKIGFNRTTSLVFVFLFSAFFHEYVISLSLGFFYPVLMVVYSTVGVYMVFLTKKRKSNFWNTFMWSMLFSGWGLMVCFYAIEWYARVNCQRTEDSDIKDFFKPRSWDKTCHILSYS